MSISPKINMKNNKSFKKDESMLSNINESENSFDNYKNYINLKNTFYKTEKNKGKKINKDLSILNFITEKSGVTCSVKTFASDSIPEKFEYDLNMVNKYDENLDSNLSFISEFDLEENESNPNDSFNSCDNDNSLEEEIEIVSKTNNKRISCDNIYKREETDFELEKEWNDIKELLLKKKVTQSCI